MDHLSIRLVSRHDGWHKDKPMEGRKTKILIVDDEPDVVETLKHFFSFRGYDVAGALGGNEVLGILEKERKDLILLDNVMPGLNGSEVVKIIKEKYPSTKVVMVTGYPKEGERIFNENLLDGLFLKPIRIQELYTKVEDALKSKESHLGLKLKPQSKESIKASVLFIKASLLFLEPSRKNYSFLTGYFKKLSDSGENYYFEVAGNKNELIEKLSYFKADIILVNTALFKDIDSIPLILENKNLPSSEIIAYNMKDVLPRAELEKLAKTIEAVCLKDGFLEIGEKEI